MMDLNNDYQITHGMMMNLTADLSLINWLGGAVNTYGANTTVNYMTAFFEGFTQMENNIPVIQIGNSDYILIEITLPDQSHWFSKHNLLLFTSYFYASVKDGTPYPIFGSLDESLLFDQSDVYPGSRINICITAATDIAAHFKNQGFYISKIPSDYNQAENQSSYNFLLRFGSNDPKVDDTLFFRDQINMSYHQYGGDRQQSTFTSQEIKASAPLPGLPGKSTSNIRVTKRFQALETYLDQVFTLQGKNPLYPYLSNLTEPPVDYAIQSFYDSIELPIPINVQANNTRENYFMSNYIAVQTDDFEPVYLHILYLNQNAAGAALTSNIQIYDGEDNSHQLINLNPPKTALITTAPDLPPFSQSDYPYVAAEELEKYPDFGIVSLSMSEIQNNNQYMNQMLVVERFSYNPHHLNHTDYSKCHSSIAYVGPALTDENKAYLKSHFPKICLNGESLS